MRVVDAFDALDKDSKGFLTEFEVLNYFYYISINQFRDFLDQHRFYATREELKLLVDRYDVNKDGRVTLGEVRFFKIS